MAAAGADPKMAIFSHVGLLVKLGGKIKNWLERGFALEADAKALHYFRSARDFNVYAAAPHSQQSKVAGTINLDNATMFLAFYAEYDNCIEITTNSSDGSIRHYYVYASNREAIEVWISHLAAAGVEYVSPIANAAELSLVFAHNDARAKFGMQGFLDKRGAWNKSFKQRFFRIQRHQNGYALDYFGRYDDVKPKGSIMLHGAELDAAPADTAADSYCFDIKTAERTYSLRASTEPEKQIWLDSCKRFVKDPSPSELVIDTDLWKVATGQQGARTVPRESMSVAEMSVTPAPSEDPQLSDVDEEDKKESVHDNGVTEDKKVAPQDTTQEVEEVASAAAAPASSDSDDTPTQKDPEEEVVDPVDSTPPLPDPPAEDAPHAGTVDEAAQPVDEPQDPQPSEEKSRPGSSDSPPELPAADDKKSDDRPRTESSVYQSLAEEAKLSRLPTAKPVDTVAPEQSAAAKAEQRKERELKFKQLLEKGTVFTKHGRQGKPHSKFVFLSGGALYWCDPNQRKTNKSKCIALKTIRDVTAGKETPVFQRPTAQSAPESVCFSIAGSSLDGKARTLDLQAEDTSTRAEWMEAISVAMAKKR